MVMKGCRVPPKRGRKRAVSAQYEVRLKMATAKPGWGRPNHRKSYAMQCGWATWTRFFCFWGVRVTPGAQWPASVAAQVIWQAKQTKFGFIQVCSSAPHLSWRRAVHSMAVTYMIWSSFFPCAFVDSEIAEMDGPQIFDWMVVGSNALRSGLFVASLFFVRQQSDQEHERNICLIWAIANLRRTLHCAETRRFFPNLFTWRYTTPPWSCKAWSLHRSYPCSPNVARHIRAEQGDLLILLFRCLGYDEWIFFSWK